MPRRWHTTALSWSAFGSLFRRRLRHQGPPRLVLRRVQCASTTPPSKQPEVLLPSISVFLPLLSRGGRGCSCGSNTSPKTAFLKTRLWVRPTQIRSCARDAVVQRTPQVARIVDGAFARKVPQDDAKKGRGRVHSQRQTPCTTLVWPLGPPAEHATSPPQLHTPASRENAASRSAGRQDPGLPTLRVCWDAIPGRLRGVFGSPLGTVGRTNFGGRGGGGGPTRVDVAARRRSWGRRSVGPQRGAY